MRSALQVYDYASPVRVWLNLMENAMYQGLGVYTAVVGFVNIVPRFILGKLLLRSSMKKPLNKEIRESIRKVYGIELTDSQINKHFTRCRKNGITDTSEILKRFRNLETTEQKELRQLKKLIMSTELTTEEYDVLNYKSFVLSRCKPADEFSFDEEQRALLHAIGLFAQSCVNGLLHYSSIEDVDNDNHNHNQSHIIHMVVGLLGEIGELMDNLKRDWIYGLEVTDQVIENRKEELSDLMFYTVGVGSEQLYTLFINIVLLMGFEEDEIKLFNVRKLRKRNPKVKFDKNAAAAKVDHVEEAGKS